MTLLEQVDLAESYLQDDPALVRTLRMIVKNELVHSDLETRLVKELLHTFECLAMRDHFLVLRGLFSEFAASDISPTYP